MYIEAKWLEHEQDNKMKSESLLRRSLFVSAVVASAVIGYNVSSTSIRAQGVEDETSETSLVQETFESPSESDSEIEITESTETSEQILVEEETETTTEKNEQEDVVTDSVVTFKALRVASTTSTVKNGWYDNNTTYYKNGTKVTGFQTIDGNTYYFNESGVKQTNQKKIGDYYYCFDNDTGIMKTGFVYLNSEYHAKNESDKTVYYDAQGRMKYKQQKIGDYYYCFDKWSGAMKTGFYTLIGDYHATNESDKTVYYDAQGRMKYKQQKIGDYYYCFDKYSGAMKTGFYTLTGNYHATNESDKTVYYNVLGRMLYKQNYIDGYWYCFDQYSGSMKTGFFTLNGNYKSSNEIVKTVFYDLDGKMKLTAFTYNGVKYVVNSTTGAVCTKQYTPTYYSQRDSRWATLMYGSYTIKSSGCVPTSISMAVNGILSDGTTPVTVADYLYYNTTEFNRYWGGSSGLSISYAADNYGLNYVGIDSSSTLSTALDNGQVVVFLVGAGNFTSGNHGIVLYGYNNGKTYVYDPNNASKNGWYDINSIWNQKSSSSTCWRGGYIGYGLFS